MSKKKKRKRHSTERAPGTQSLEIAPEFPDAYHTIGTTYTAMGR